MGLASFTQLSTQDPHLLASVQPNTLGGTVLGGDNTISQGGGLFQSPLDGKKEERAEAGSSRWAGSQRRMSLL